MACRSDKREIQGRIYTVTQMPATVSIPIQVKLAQMLSSAAGPLLKQVTGGGGENVGMQALSDAFGAVGDIITNHMPPNEFLAFAQKLANPAYVHVSAKDHEVAPLDFESEFSGDDMVRLYPLLLFILEVNYASFFGASGLGKLLDMAKAKLQSQNSSPSPQT